MGYTIEFAKAAAKALQKLPPKTIQRIVPIINSLADNPRPSGLTRLVNSKMYRIRVGDYRIIYDILDDILQVLILKIGHRRDIYKSK